MSRNESDRKDRSSGGNNRAAAMNRTALQIDQGEFTERIRSALVIEFGAHKDAVKLVARAADAGTRAAKNWLRGDNAPDGLHLMRLAQAVPRVGSEVRRLMGMQSDLDPEFERDLHALFQSYARIRKDDGS